MPLNSSIMAENSKIESIQDFLPAFKELSEMPASSAAELEKLILAASDVLTIFSEQDARAFINMTRETENKTYIDRHELFSQTLQPEFTKLMHEINLKIYHSPAFQNLPHPRYDMFKQSLAREIELYRDENISLETDIAKHTLEFNQLSGSLTAIIDGEEMPLPKAQAKLQNTERNERQKAWEAIQKTRADKKENFDNIFDALVPLRNKIALNAGYKNYRDYKHDELERFDYSVNDVLTFHLSVKNCVVPLVKKISEAHRSAMGLENDYRPWDTDAPLPGENPLKPFTHGEELLEKTIRIFSKLHPEFGANLIKMKNANLFDLDSRQGKAPGGYNYGLELTGMPFIFMNAAGTHRDLVTLMHEGGHAMHTFLTNREPLVFYRNFPSEMAETASMSMELMTMHLWGEFYDAKDWRQAQRQQLRDIISFFPWCMTVDCFQHWIYENPEHTASERHDAFQKIWESFSPGVVNWQGYESLRKIQWQRQLHIFEIPFYYIEYAIAQLGALQVYRNFLQDPKKALQGYMHGLQAGSSKPLPKIWESMGIKFDFSERNLESLMSFVWEQYEKL